MKKSVRVSMSLDSETFAAIKEVAKRTRSNASQVVREAIMMAYMKAEAACAARPCAGSNAHGRLLPDSGCVASPANPAHAAARTAEARAGSTGRSKSKAG
jgi:predicted transcriptional regulator